MKTINDLELFFQDAASTLRRLPSAMPYAKLCAWPDIVRDLNEAYGWNAAELKRIPPSPEEIEEMDIALSWILCVDERSRRIIWARACNISWPLLSKFLKKRSTERGLSIRNLQILHKKALETIFKKNLARFA